MARMYQVRTLDGLTGVRLLSQGLEQIVIVAAKSDALRHSLTILVKWLLGKASTKRATCRAGPTNLLLNLRVSADAVQDTLRVVRSVVDPVNTLTASVESPTLRVTPREAGLFSDFTPPYGTGSSYFTESQLAWLLDGIARTYPPCGAATVTLAGMTVGVEPMMERVSSKGTIPECDFWHVFTKTDTGWEGLHARYPLEIAGKTLRGVADSLDRIEPSLVDKNVLRSSATRESCIATATNTGFMETGRTTIPYLDSKGDDIPAGQVVVRRAVWPPTSFCLRVVRGGGG